MNTDKMINAYVICALWSSVDDNDAPLDDNYTASDIAPESFADMQDDCVRFLSEAAAIIPHLPEHYGDEDQIGHDFWLTRNGHGAGFWDRGDAKALTDLTELSAQFGSVDLYVGDDSQIHSL